MNAPRNVVIAGILASVACALVALSLSASSGDPAPRRADAAALDAGPAPTVAPAEAPSSPPVDPAAPDVTTTPPTRPGPAPVAPPAPPAPDAPPVKVPVPLKPVPLADRDGPAISNIRFRACIVEADVIDPAGVATVTLSWAGLPDLGIPGQWIVAPGSTAMQRTAGDTFDSGRPQAARGQLFTVTAVDRTMVGNRSSVSVPFPWDFDACF